MRGTGELWSWDAVDIARAVRTRLISSREAVLACLGRIEEVNPRINAVVEMRAEEALDMADAADRAVCRGADIGPLLGVPVTIKINVDQALYATSNGVVAFKDRVASQDSPVVANLRKAGAVFIGRTNTPAFSHRWFTANDAHGETLNPRNERLTPGGSSGGAASAVAAGFGPLALGNDYGGSIRYPAYACGVLGLRPTIGRVPAFNATSVERPVTAHLMSVQGPLARTVRDLRVGLAAMAAADPRDPCWTPAPLDGPSLFRPIRVAMSVDPFGRGVHPSVEDSVRTAARCLTNAGYLVEEVQLPRISEAADLWTLLAMNDSRRALLPAVLAYGDAATQHVLQTMLHNTPQVDLDSYTEGLERRTTILREWLIFLERFPLALLPVSMEPPFEQHLDLQGAEVMGSIMKAQAPLLSLAVLGLPAISVPTSVRGGIPLGVQLVASRFREDICLDAAEVLEAQCPIPIAQL
ncbi:amidase family protein [Tardiphaga robiniae]|uniref:Indoleacetamide hydrolase n=1 Tax=Tardiphaga robiniae TaxID=943830 RepID=A0A7G6U1J1_9BRAD|nr:amidase family protein [Tardiphaga robiniae]QND72873.1 amidase family protein [Tardiphaga robiniae]